MNIVKKFKKEKELKERAEKERQLDEAKRRSAEVIVNIEEQVDSLRNLIASYENSAEEAAKIGEDEFADELIDTIIDLEDFIRDLEFVKIKVKTEILTAITFSSLGDLTAVISSLKDLYRSAPDFSKLASEMAALSNTFGTARKGLKDFRNGLSKNKNDMFDKLFPGQKKADDPNREERKKKKKRDLVAKLTVSDTTVAAAPAKTAGNDANNSIDDLASMLDDERNK